MSSPDLFVVCKSCGAEVSPYITECPYCGNRLRKRAPNLDKPPRPPRISRRTARPPRERSSRIATGRPYATLLLAALSIVVTLAATLFGRVLEETWLLPGAFADEPWRAVTTLFVYGSDGYQVVVLAIAFLFGWLLESRHGGWATLLVFLLAGAAGAAAAASYDESAFVLGANGAALGLIAAWAVRPLLERRRSGDDDDDRDLLGAAIVAALVLALPLATVEAHWLAGIAGGAVGLLLGLVLSRLREA